MMRSMGAFGLACGVSTVGRSWWYGLLGLISQGGRLAHHVGLEGVAFIPFWRLSRARPAIRGKPGDPLDQVSNSPNLLRETGQRNRHGSPFELEPGRPANA